MSETERAGVWKVVSLSKAYVDIHCNLTFFLKSFIAKKKKIHNFQKY